VSPASILIITGYSGSGKSIALAALEDIGFYCVDNMPVALLPKFMDLATESVPEAKGFAFVMDLREKGFLGNYAEVFDALRRQGCHLQILFLEADEKTLLQRYSQTRRQHPLASEGSVLKGIKSEKEYLQPLREAADWIISTSHYNVHELKSVIVETAKKRNSASPIAIQILSFGYKYGPPFDADLIMDVRFLTNPYFIPDLKPLTGTADPVKRFVLSDPNCAPFLEKYMDLLTFLIPLYEKEGKSYLTIAVGCTGGRHRSVAIAEYLYGKLKKPGLWISLSHRDMEQ
jgi:RNase adapter protein RapZ